MSQPSAVLAVTLTGSTGGQSSIPAYSFAVDYPSLALTGAGTYTVDLAGMPSTGCKALVVAFDAFDVFGATAAGAITVARTVNGVVLNEAMAPGDVMAHASSAKATTALAIQYLAGALLHISARG